jgi:hypothetical protein
MGVFMIIYIHFVEKSIAAKNKPGNKKAKTKAKTKENKTYN